jgi:hypothetical protein
MVFPMSVKMRVLLLMLAACCLLPSQGFGALSESRVKQKIETLLRDPTSDAARMAGAEVIKFAGKSPKYHIELKVGYMPWVKDSSLPRGSQILLAAFIAGNLREQMRKNSSQPEPYAGVQATLEVYQKIKRQDPDFHIPGVEKFIAMEQAGTLKRHIASVR